MKPSQGVMKVCMRQQLKAEKGQYLNCWKSQVAIGWWCRNIHEFNKSRICVCNWYQNIKYQQVQIYPSSRFLITFPPNGYFVSNIFFLTKSKIAIQIKTKSATIAFFFFSFLSPRPSFSPFGAYRAQNACLLMTFASNDCNFVKLVFKNSVWYKVVKICIFCFILLLTSSSPCRKDQF